MNAEQLTIGTQFKKFPRSTIIIITIMATLLGIIAMFLMLSPNALEAKSIQLLNNQTAWWAEQAKITEYESKIEESKQLQDQLHQENAVLQEEITASLSGF